MKQFNVYLNGKLIDRITSKGTKEEVYRSLVNHDGYDSRIKVRRRQKPRQVHPEMKAMMQAMREKKRIKS